MRVPRPITRRRTHAQPIDADRPARSLTFVPLQAVARGEDTGTSAPAHRRVNARSDPVGVGRHLEAEGARWHRPRTATTAVPPRTHHEPQDLDQPPRTINDDGTRRGRAGRDEEQTDDRRRCGRSRGMGSGEGGRNGTGSAHRGRIPLRAACPPGGPPARSSPSRMRRPMVHAAGGTIPGSPCSTPWRMACAVTSTWWRAAAGGELMLLHAAAGAPREPFGQHPVPDDLYGPAGRDEPGCIDAPPAAPVEPHVSACGGGRGVDRRVDGHHPLPRPAARSPTHRVELAGHAGSF